MIGGSVAYPILFILWDAAPAFRVQAILHVRRRAGSSFPFTCSHDYGGEV